MSVEDRREEGGPFQEYDVGRLPGMCFAMDYLKSRAAGYLELGAAGGSKYFSTIHCGCQRSGSRA